MQTITTGDSLHGNRREPQAWFSRPRTHSPVQPHQPGPDSPLTAPKLPAEQATRTKGPVRMCDDPVAISASGKNWHHYHRVRTCPRCSESARLNAIYRRLTHGRIVQVSLTDMVAFADAYASLPESKGRAVDAARAMVSGMARP